MTFDPGYHVTQGQVRRLIWFATSDPEQPWVEVRITGCTDIGWTRLSRLIARTPPNGALRDGPYTSGSADLLGSQLVWR